MLPEGANDTTMERKDASSQRVPRGKLTIFFGSVSGVGKTYAMLESARLEREDGRDVVIGIVDTHEDYGTTTLLLGLELLPKKGGTLDLDRALLRRPGLLVVDELAHKNPDGCRHAHRWQDVEELLESGIDVYTTLNVQDLASQSDVITRISETVVLGTVPDTVFEQADDVRLIDLPSRRVRQPGEGSREEDTVRQPDEGSQEKDSVRGSGAPTPDRFYREGNLIALRELSLRLTAQRLEAQMRRHREKHGIERTWAVAERLLVCVSPSPTSDRLVRSARRLASSLHADWIAVWVEAPSSTLSGADRDRIDHHLRLAQSLGADTMILSGMLGPDEVVRFAKARSVTRIVVGKPTHASWRDRLKPSFLDQVVRRSGDIEVHVLAGDDHAAPRATSRAFGRARELTVAPSGVLASLGAVVATTLLGRAIFGAHQLADVIMIFLLGIVLVSLRWGLGSSIVAGVLSVLALAYFFIPPERTLAVHDMSHLTTFVVMFIVTAIISGLTKRVRDQANAARERETRTASLYALLKTLSQATTTEEIAAAAVQHVHDVFGVRSSIVVSRANDGALVPVTPSDGWSYPSRDRELGVAEWAWQHNKAAGFGTDTLPSAEATYVPLEASGERVGVLVVDARNRGDAHSPRALGSEPNRQHLTTFARQIAVALGRAHLAKRAQEAQLRVEAEQLRNSLLSSVSHDLRTPLAVITGAASAIHDRDAKLEPGVRKELAGTIVTEAELLHRLVRNLLDMTRLEAGAVHVKKEWQPVEEAVGSALDRASRQIEGRRVKTDLPVDLPLVPYDTILLQQVLLNLFENAAKYTPKDSEIEVSARALPSLTAPTEVEVVVADRGPGLPPGEETKIFSKFYRAEKGRGGGVGLGLTICRGIISAHGGRIWAERREGGGSAFHFTLPIEGSPPSLREDAPERERSAAQ